MTAPDDKIRIPLNESQDEHSQIEEFLKQYKGEGIQHLALATDDIFATVDKLRANGIRFQDTPESYFDMIDSRVPGHGHDVAAMRKRRILIDGAPETGGGILLQIFTENMVGPIFFEIIQRKGNEGFGEGNFKALFESLELDQIRRGVVKVVHELRAMNYLSGFGNHFATESIPGALPEGRNSPQRTAFGLYAEQLSGTRLHGAARREPAQLAVSFAPLGGACTLRSLSA